MIPSDLPAHWRETATVLQRFGAGDTAAAIVRCAEELDEALRVSRAEVLTLGEAAQESGYSADRLAHLVREGTIPNAGRKHAPRILRRDLPRKPKPDAGRGLAEVSPAAPSLARITRDAIASRTGRR